MKHLILSSHTDTQRGIPLLNGHTWVCFLINSHMWVFLPFVPESTNVRVQVSSLCVSSVSTFVTFTGSHLLAYLFCTVYVPPLQIVEMFPFSGPRPRVRTLGS